MFSFKNAYEDNKIIMQKYDIHKAQKLCVCLYPPNFNDAGKGLYHARLGNIGFIRVKT